MALRQEQVVLIATAAVLGLLVWRSGGGEVRRPRPRSTRPPELARHVVPDVEQALPQARTRPGGSVERDLFAPPRDTQPLPPLTLAEPPLPALSGLRPPGQPGPSARHFGAWLRAPAEPTPVAGLFLASEEDLADEALLGDVAGGPAGLAAAIGGQAPPDDVTLTPDERAARLESWKRLYDWVRVDAGEPLFGRIANPDRYGLAQRPEEALLFVQFEPRTGQERFPGMAPASYERQRVIEFAFADTPSNRIQLRRREFLSAMSPGRYGDLLAFAESCVELRLEAREALRVAEEMYRLADEHAQGDPAPRLGLARCKEAAFELEQAYEIYLALLADFGHRAEVHVGLAELEARLRLFDSAEERLRHAERLERLSWRVQLALGEFLYARGRFDEALPHFEAAYRSEPADPQQKTTRAEIRAALGRSLLASGQVQRALDTYTRALQADAGLESAQAGRLAAERLLRGASGSALNGGGGTRAQALEQAGFELLLVHGLVALDAGDHAGARDLLQQAAGSDPLRAGVAWGALAWLAELTGYPEEAFRFVEQAHEADPEHAWTLYQRGRVLAARDDLAGARESFVGALDHEIDFVDALVALADLARRTSDLLAAELYLERALSIDPQRAEVHALRGLGLLELGDVDAAEGALRAALAIEAEQPLAQAGLAWVAYRRGDSERAIRLLAELDDRRRALPQDEPYRVWAQGQIERIRDHESKELWSDRFERRELRNNWFVEESAGPQVRLLDGRLVLAGDFRENGTSRAWREYSAPDFVSIELLISVAPTNNARVGLFVAKERRRGGGQDEVQGMVAIARRKDGGLVLRTEDRAAADPQWEDVPPLEGQAWWPAGQPVRLRIERSGEGSDAVGRLSIDGVPVAAGFAMRQLSSSTNLLKVGVFAEGQTGLPAALSVDDVQVVYQVAR